MTKIVLFLFQFESSRYTTVLKSSNDSQHLKNVFCSQKKNENFLSYTQQNMSKLVTYLTINKIMKIVGNCRIQLITY